MSLTGIARQWASARRAHARRAAGALGIEHRAAVERIDEDLDAALGEHHQEMRRGVEARRAQSRRARSVHVEDAQRHRHATAALDYLDEIGVLRGSS